MNEPRRSSQAAPKRAHAARTRRLCGLAARLTANAFGVSTRDLLASQRGPAVIALARQTAMYLGHTAFGMSLTAVGEGFRRDRTTAAHACRLIEERREDPQIDAMLGVLEIPLHRTRRSGRSRGGAAAMKRAARQSGALNMARPEAGELGARALATSRRMVDSGSGRTTVVVNDAESPLAWLARRKGRDGSRLIDAVQLEAGERLRADFTRAHMTPRTTSNWSSPVASRGRGGGDAAVHMTDAIIAARQRVRHALDAVGPEFAGLLLDVCCFLKGLEEVERERRWPLRSAKVVLQLGLDRLARHYGYRRQLRGPARQAVRTWLAEGAEFSVGSD